MIQFNLLSFIAGKALRRSRGSAENIRHATPFHFAGWRSNGVAGLLGERARGRGGNRGRRGQLGLLKCLSQAGQVALQGEVAKEVVPKPLPGIRRHQRQQRIGNGSR